MTTKRVRNDSSENGPEGCTAPLAYEKQQHQDDDDQLVSIRNKFHPSPPEKKQHQESREDSTLRTSTTLNNSVTSSTTTRIIPADHRIGFPKRINEFSRKFQYETYPELKRIYKNAQRSHKLDMNGWYKGIRLINGNRYEVQVRGQFMKETFKEFPDLLICYAESLALHDIGVQQMVATTATSTTKMADDPITDSPPKSRKRQRRHIFSEWSMIISEKCDQQTIHIDVPYDNYQFGLILQGGGHNDGSDGDGDHSNKDESVVPGTHVLNDATLGPYTIEDLFTTIWPDAPLSLKQMFSTTITNSSSIKQQKLNDKLLRILEAYGPLLQPKSVLDKKMVPANQISPSKRLHCGDLISTKGGIPHFGPACNKFRMVMFGAVSSSEEDLYNVDDQYFAHTAILFIIQIVWDVANLESRSFLLHKLADVVSQYDPIVITNHQYLSNEFCVFMNVIAKKARHNVRAVDLAVQRFLHTHEKTMESTLFQYRPPRVWNTTTSTTLVTSSNKTSHRKRFLKSFDDYKCV